MTQAVRSRVSPISRFDWQSDQDHNDGDGDERSAKCCQKLAADNTLSNPWTMLLLSTCGSQWLQKAQMNKLSRHTAQKTSSSCHAFITKSG